VSAVMNLRVPRNAGNFLTSCKPVSFSRRTPHHGVSKYASFVYVYFSCICLSGRLEHNSVFVGLGGLGCKGQ